MKNNIMLVTGLFCHYLPYSTKDNGVLALNKNVTYYPLTHPQLGIWYTEKLYPGTSIGNIAGTLKLKGNIDYSLLKRAVHIYAENTDALRLHFVEINGEPKQYYSEFTTPNIDFHDFSKDGKEALYEWDTSRTQIPFQLIDNDLYEFCIFKLSDTEAGIYGKLHHLICDGWSFVNLGSEIVKIYSMLSLGNSGTYEANPSYTEFIKSEAEYMRSRKFTKDQEFWEKVYERYPESTALKTRKSNFHSSRSKRKSFVLPAKLNRKIYDFCAENRTSIFMLYFAAFSIYINRVTEKDDIVIGVPVLNRSNAIEKKTLGMFINTLPVRISINNNSSFSDFLAVVTKEWMNALKHHKYPYDLIAGFVREQHKVVDDMFDITLSYQNVKFSKDNITDYEGRWHFCGHQRSPLNIHLNDRENEGSIIIDYDYLVDVFYAKEIEFIHDHVIRLLWHALDNPGKTVGRLDMVSEKEKNKILYEFNQTACDYPKDKNIIRLFEEQAERSPNSCAVIYGDKTLTYDSFNKRVNELAWKLIDVGVKPGDIIAILIPRNIYSLISIYAVLKCGAVFLPIDPMYPEDRIKYMLDDSAPKLILYTDEKMHTDFGEASNWINVTRFYSMSSENPHIYPDKDSLAYVIYTSGSTGRPKAAMITNKGLVNYIVWADKVYVRGDKMTFPLYSSLSFDLTITSIFTPLISGNSIVVYEENDIEPPIIKVFKDNYSDIVKLTPAHLSLIKDLNNSRSRIKRLIVGGEDLKTELARQVYKSFNDNVEIYNEYGPTETVVGCMIYKFDYSKDNKTSVPIGKPADNVKIYILDRFLNPVPIGTPGELYIGGDGVCAGYLNNPDMTREKFIPDPFGKNGMIYKTGDLARWFPQGDVEFLGRIDDQVKIKGYRVELGEIETQLLSHNDVSGAVVLDFDEGSKKYLCAYVKASNCISVEDLRSYLAKKLPSYMIPSYFMFIDHIPLTHNGKVDKRSLPKPQVDYKQTSYVAPSNEIETAIAAAIQEVLGIEEVGVYDNFIDLGIDSLNIIRIQAKLLKYDWKITTQDFYEYPNIKLLSERVTCKISYTDEFIEINTEKKRFTPVFHGTKPNEGCIFITGSTGFLGAHLLDTIIRKTNYTVYCLVRESTYERACRKLADRLDFYFKNSNYKQLFNNRIYVVKGDFTLHKLGLSDNEYDSLGKRIQCIIHSGALVNHYGNPEIFEKTNIFGTEQIADLAEQFDKPLAHISTTSVSGISVSPCNKIYEFTENDIYYGQEFNNIYIKTKHLAEDFIVNEISRNKLKASIYRIGNLTGRFSDGVFQINSSDNLFYNRVYSIIKLGFIPENYLGMVVDLTPVDYCCDAILQMIMKYYDRSDIYHIYNNHQISILQLVNLLNRIGKHIEIRDFDQFNNKLSKMYDKNTNENSIYSFINDMNEYFLFKNTVRLNSNKTLKLLKNVGFEWPICNEDYISRLYGNIEQDKSLIVEDVV